MRYIAILLLFTGCYSANKARNQFSKAVTHSPELAATYCAITYPVKERVIQGRDSIRTDTLYGTQYVTDTVRSKDTVYITKYFQGSTIRETIIRTDTILKENTAEVEAERLNNKALTRLLSDTTGDRDRLKAARNKWRMIAIGLMIALGLGIFLKIKRIL